MPGGRPPHESLANRLAVVLEVDVQNAWVDHLDLRFDTVDLQRERVHESLPVRTQGGLKRAGVAPARGRAHCRAWPADATRRVP